MSLFRPTTRHLRIDIFNPGAPCLSLGLLHKAGLGYSSVDFVAVLLSLARLCNSDMLNWDR